MESSLTAPLIESEEKKKEIGVLPVVKEVVKKDDGTIVSGEIGMNNNNSNTMN
jgi:hypothetical protein